VVSIVTSKGEVSAPIGLSAFDNAYVKFGIMAVLILVTVILFEKTAFGKHLKAIGGNLEAARQAGIKVDRVRISAYLILGLFTAIAAIVAAPRASIVNPNTGAGYEMDVLIALLLGGIPLSGGSKVRSWCAVIGCIILVIMENGLTLCGLESHMINCIKCVIFLVMVYFNYERSKKEIVM